MKVVTIGKYSPAGRVALAEATIEQRRAAMDNNAIASGSVESLIVCAEVDANRLTESQRTARDAFSSITEA